MGRLINLMNIYLVQEEDEIKVEKPKEISQQEWEKTRTSEALKKEFELNKERLDKNLKMLQQKVELHQSNLDFLEFEKKKFELNKSMLDLEASDARILSPIMGFHENPDWKIKFVESKMLAIEEIERNWKNVQDNFEGQKKRIDSMFDEEKIKEQNKRIKERNPEIEYQLEELK